MKLIRIPLVVCIFLSHPHLSIAAPHELKTKEKTLETHYGTDQFALEPTEEDLELSNTIKRMRKQERSPEEIERKITKIQARFRAKQEKLRSEIKDKEERKATKLYQDQIKAMLNDLKKNRDLASFIKKKLLKELLKQPRNIDALEDIQTYVEVSYSFLAPLYEELDTLLALHQDNSDTLKRHNEILHRCNSIRALLLKINDIEQAIFLRRGSSARAEKPVRTVIHRQLLLERAKQTLSNLKQKSKKDEKEIEQEYRKSYLKLKGQVDQKLEGANVSALRKTLLKNWFQSLPTSGLHFNKIERFFDQIDRAEINALQKYKVLQDQIIQFQRFKSDGDYHWDRSDFSDQAIAQDISHLIVLLRDAKESLKASAPIYSYPDQLFYDGDFQSTQRQAMEVLQSYGRSKRNQKLIGTLQNTGTRTAQVAGYAIATPFLLGWWISEKTIIPLVKHTGKAVWAGGKWIYEETENGLASFKDQQQKKEIYAQRYAVLKREIAERLSDQKHSPLYKVILSRTFKQIPQTGITTETLDHFESRFQFHLAESSQSYLAVEQLVTQIKNGSSQKDIQQLKTLLLEARKSKQCKSLPRETSTPSESPYHGDFNQTEREVKDLLNRLPKKEYRPFFTLRQWVQKRSTSQDRLRLENLAMPHKEFKEFLLEKYRHRQVFSEEGLAELFLEKTATLRLHLKELQTTEPTHESEQPLHIAYLDLLLERLNEIFANPSDHSPVTDEDLTAIQKEAFHLISQNKIVEDAYRNIALGKKEIKQIQSLREITEHERIYLKELKRAIKAVQKKIRKGKSIQEEEADIITRAKAQTSQKIDTYDQEIGSQGIKKRIAKKKFEEEVREYALREERHIDSLILAQLTGKQARRAFEYSLDFSREQKNENEMSAENIERMRKLEAEEAYSDFLRARINEEDTGTSLIVIAADAEQSKETFFKNFVSLPPTPEQGFDQNHECLICGENVAFEFKSLSSLISVSPDQDALIQTPVDPKGHRLSVCGHFIHRICLEGHQSNRGLSIYKCPRCQRMIPYHELDPEHWQQKYGYCWN